MAIYGDSLNAFPELFTNIHCWEGVPKAGGGYDIGQELDVTGIILNLASSPGIQPRNYGDGYALDVETEDLLWVRNDSPIRLGLFLYHPLNGTICRVVRQYDKSLPGGYKRFVIERVNGANGLNNQDIPISGGRYL